MSSAPGVARQVGEQYVRGAMSQTPDDRQHAAPSEYGRNPHSSATPTAGEAIEIARSILLPGATHKQMPALFDGRASYHTIRDWRRGKLKWPAWARDLLGAKLTAHLSQQFKSVDKIMRAEIGRGNITDPTGSHFRKQKPGS